MQNKVITDLGEFYSSIVHMTSTYFVHVDNIYLNYAVLDITC